jgi:hypothetical protein
MWCEPLVQKPAVGKERAAVPVSGVSALYQLLDVTFLTQDRTQYVHTHARPHGIRPCHATSLYTTSVQTRRSDRPRLLRWRGSKVRLRIAEQKTGRNGHRGLRANDCTALEVMPAESFQSIMRTVLVQCCSGGRDTRLDLALVPQRQNCKNAVLYARQTLAHIDILTYAA